MRPHPSLLLFAALLAVPSTACAMADAAAPRFAPSTATFLTAPSDTGRTLDSARKVIARQKARWDSVAAVVQPALDRYCKTSKTVGYLCGTSGASVLLKGLTVEGQADTLATPRDTTVIVVVPPPVDSAPPADSTPNDSSVVQSGGPAPSSPVYSIPAGLGLNVATVAELPRATVDESYPTTTSLVRVPAGANLQAVLNAAKPGDLIALAPGAVFTGDFMLPKHAGAQDNACSGWVVIRTDLSDDQLGAPGTRMTPSKAAALKLAKLQSPDNQQAIGSAWGVPNVGCWRIVGVEVQQQPGNANASNANGLVRFGDYTTTDSTQQAHHLILDRAYVHGPRVRRCVILNSRSNAVVDSWLEQCSGGDGDTQAVFLFAGTGPYLIRNNTLSGGTEVLMSGGATSAIVGAVPSDLTIHGNLFTRDLADTVTLVKNLFELKNAERVDLAGNILRGNWVNGQVGYAVLVKSVNQSSGACTWCRSRDVTIRYNRITQSANGINLAGIQEGPAQPAMRYTLYGNLVDSLRYVAAKSLPNQEQAEGRPIQILGNASLSDVILANNTVGGWSYNAAGDWGLVSYDGGPTPRQAWQGNVLWCGGYGAKGSGTSSGTATFAAYAPGMGWSGNALYGCTGGFPSGSTYSPTPPAGGANLDALLRNVEVPR